MRVGMQEMDDKAAPKVTFDGVAPLHFYGELVKTAEGRMIMEAKGHFQQFVNTIRTHGMESSDLEVIAKLKSVLWAVVRSPCEECLDLANAGPLEGPYRIHRGRCRIPGA